MREDPCRVEALSVLSSVPDRFLRCPVGPRDVLFELTDALLCTDGPVRSLVDLVLAPGAPAWSRRHVRRSEQRPHRGRPAAADSGRAAAAAGRRRADRPGRRCVRRGCARTPRPARTGCSATSTAGRRTLPADPGLAVLVRRRAGNRPDLMDGDPGRGPPRTRRRHRRGHRGPGPRRRRTPDRRRAAHTRRPADPDRRRRRLRHPPPRLRPGRPARRRPGPAALRPGHAPGRHHHAYPAPSGGPATTAPNCPSPTPPPGPPHTP